MRPHAGDVDGALVAQDDGGVDQRRPVVGVRTPATEAGVELELDGSGATAITSGCSDVLELVDGVCRQLDLGVDGQVVALTRDAQPAQHRPGVARGSQLERLADQGHAQPVGAADTGRTSGLDDAVAVAVGLDDRDQVATLDVCPQAPRRWR